MLLAITVDKMRLVSVTNLTKASISTPTGQTAVIEADLSLT